MVTIEQFRDTVKEINELNNRAKQLQKSFECEAGELSEAFHWIIENELRESKHCCLTTGSCSKEYAKQLQDLGFRVEEMRNAGNVLCGYDVRWY